MTEAPKITDLPEFWQGFIEEVNAENKRLSDLYEAVKAERDDLLTALDNLLHAICGETSFAECARKDSATPHLWSVRDLAKQTARSLIERIKSKRQSDG